MPETTTYTKKLKAKIEEIHAGGYQKYHNKNKESGKLFVRERLVLLFDEGQYE